MPCAVLQDTMKQCRKNSDMHTSLPTTVGVRDSGRKDDDVHYMPVYTVSKGTWLGDKPAPSTCLLLIAPVWRCTSKDFSMIRCEITGRPDRRGIARSSDSVRRTSAERKSAKRTRRERAYARLFAQSPPSFPHFHSFDEQDRIFPATI